MIKRLVLLVICVLTFVIPSYALFENLAKPKEPAKAADPAAANAHFGEMMNELTVSMATWPGLSAEDKKKAVDAVMMFYKTRENSAILRNPEFYVQKIDENLRGNPSMAALSLPAVTKILAVMEYDFYNGEDKEELAKKILGPKMYEDNKRRLQMSLMR